MKKKLIALGTILVLGFSGITAFAFAKNSDATVATQAAEENPTSSIEGSTIVLRSFYAGYIINDSDIAAIEAAAKDQDNLNAKNCADILAVLNYGQRYEDEQINCEYVIIRRKGEEDVTFLLPCKGVKIYDLRGYDFSNPTSFYKLDNVLEKSGEITGEYGSFELFH